MSLANIVIAEVLLSQGPSRYDQSTTDDAYDNAVRGEPPSVER